MTYQSQPWWQKGVVYQIYPRSFQDSNHDGIGDLHGIIQRLNYLAGLGVDAIWISPFYASPMADFGYDVADYCGVHPLFGNLETFDRLVAEAHQRSLRIIVDYVPNHTSDQHPWFVESAASRDNPKRDWYIWRDARPDGSLPNNWGSVFGGPAWTRHPVTGQYYLHQFLKEQPDLNWRNPEVRQAMLDVLRFWLQRGVDGFRMDVIGMILKDAELRDNPLNPTANPGLPENDLFGRQIHVYNEDQDDVHEIMRDIRSLMDEAGDRVAIGELWFPPKRWVLYYGKNNDELHLPFNFRLMEQPFTASAIRASVNEMEGLLPAWAWPNYVLGNHDQPRLASRIGPAATRLAAMLLLTLRGTPTLYQGDELGMENGIIPPDRIQDPQGLALGAERSRDVCRTPMQWDASPFAGFSTVEPWLPLSADFASQNVAEQDADPKSILTLYRRLLQLRRASPALHGGSYAPLESPETIFAFIRDSESETCLVALNFSDQPASLPITQTGRIVLSTHMDRREVRGRNLDLRPYEGIILAL